MGRVPKPVAPIVHGFPIFPTPAPADYSDEVSEQYVEELSVLVRECEGEDSEDGDEWELVDGPGW
jgi:hypothetical protein